MARPDRVNMSEPEAPAQPHESFDRVNFLELRNTQLAEAIKRVESERHYMEAEILRLQREVKRLKTELDRLRYPPLIVGSVRDVLTDGRVIVKSSTGPDFVVNSAETVEHGKVTVGSRVPVLANIFIGDINPKEIAVDIYFGVLDSRGVMVGGELVSLDSISGLTSGLYQFSGEIKCKFCGRQGFMLRVMPNHVELGAVYEPGLILWG